ncbi:MAG: hypothetical protein RIA71_13720 [Oceanicaulis sp.]
MNRLAALLEMQKSFFEGRILERFSATYVGNTALLIQTSVARDIVSTVDRLYAPATRGHESLRFLTQSFAQSRFVRRTRYRIVTRAAASGSYSIVENGAARQETWLETLSRRKYAAKAAGGRAVEACERAIESVEAFAKSKSYGQIRVFRTERISHRVWNSSDREFHSLGDVDGLANDELTKIGFEALAVGGEAFCGLFGHDLSLKNGSEIWRDHVSDFWNLIDFARAE